jgi:hypothetical protein
MKFVVWDTFDKVSTLKGFLNISVKTVILKGSTLKAHLKNAIISQKEKKMYAQFLFA